MTESGEPIEPSLGVPPRLRLLAVLTAFQGLLVITYALADLLLATGDDQAVWGAVWFVVVVLGAWGVGLLLVSRGLRHRKRWAFTPVLFTQLIFGLAALTVFSAAEPVAKIVAGVVMVIAVFMIWLLFSKEVRNALITPPEA